MFIIETEASVCLGAWVPKLISKRAARQSHGSLRIDNGNEVQLSVTQVGWYREFKSTCSGLGGNDFDVGAPAASWNGGDPSTIYVNL